MLIDIYRQAYFNRCFEHKVIEAHKKGLIKSPIYLSIGTEHIPAAIADVSKDWLVFPQHRCHSWLLSFGADPTAVAKELLGRSDGIGGGYQGSASLGDPSKNIFSHDGLLGSNLGIGAGAAHASGKKTVIHLGDAACEEMPEVLGYIATHKLPVLIVVEDNDLSILTPKATRRSWDIVQVAKGFGIDADSIMDYPHNIKSSIDSLINPHYNFIFNFPALLNIKCIRHMWHAGIGTDGPPKYDMLNEFKRQLLAWKDINTVELEMDIQAEINEIWGPLL